MIVRLTCEKRWSMDKLSTKMRRPNRLFGHGLIFSWYTRGHGVWNQYDNEVYPNRETPSRDSLCLRFVTIFWLDPETEISIVSKSANIYFVANRIWCHNFISITFSLNCTCLNTFELGVRDPPIWHLPWIFPSIDIIGLHSDLDVRVFGQVVCHVRNVE